MVKSGFQMIHTLERLKVGNVYTREDLAKLFNIKDAALRNGIFAPKNHDSVWLFVTEKKTKDRTQYKDKLDGQDLYMDGQNFGRTDKYIIESDLRGLDLLLFYRKEIYEYEKAGFKLEGVFRYQSHSGDKPKHFHLILKDKNESLSEDLAVSEAVEAVRTKRTSKGQGISISPVLRRQIELHAMTAATSYFKDLGYNVEDVSSANPYDLLAVRGKSRLYIEVKGTQTAGDTILLTPGEVNFARSNVKSMALFVLHSINVTEKHGEFTVSGGEHRLFKPWNLNSGELIPVGYSYSPSKSEKVSPGKKT